MLHIDLFFSKGVRLWWSILNLRVHASVDTLSGVLIFAPLYDTCIMKAQTAGLKKIQGWGHNRVRDTREQTVPKHCRLNLICFHFLICRTVSVNQNQNQSKKSRLVKARCAKGS